MVDELIVVHSPLLDRGDGLERFRCVAEALHAGVRTPPHLHVADDGDRFAVHALARAQQRHGTRDSLHVLHEAHHLHRVLREPNHVILLLAERRRFELHEAHELAQRLRGTERPWADGICDDSFQAFGVAFQVFGEVLAAAVRYRRLERALLAVPPRVRIRELRHDPPSDRHRVCDVLRDGDARCGDRLEHDVLAARDPEAPALDRTHDHDHTVHVVPIRLVVPVRHPRDERPDLLGELARTAGALLELQDERVVLRDARVVAQVRADRMLERIVRERAELRVGVELAEHLAGDQSECPIAAEDPGGEDRADDVGRAGDARGVRHLLGGVQKDVPGLEPLDYRTVEADPECSLGETVHLLPRELALEPFVGFQAAFAVGVGQEQHHVRRGEVGEGLKRGTDQRTPWFLGRGGIALAH